MARPNLDTRVRWRGDLAPSLRRQADAYNGMRADFIAMGMTVDHSIGRAYLRRRNRGKGRLRSQTGEWMNYVLWRHV